MITDALEDYGQFIDDDKAITGGDAAAGGELYAAIAGIRSPGPKSPHGVDPAHHVAFLVGAVGLDEFSHRIRVTQHCKGLFR
jgi:hypothetical protein